MPRHRAPGRSAGRAAGRARRYRRRPCPAGTSPTSGSAWPTSSPTLPPRSRATGARRGRDRPPGRRRRRHAARRRRDAAGQGGALPLQLPRVPRVDVRHLQGRRSSRSTRTTATATTSWCTCGQRRRRRRRVPRLASPSGSSGCATACPNVRTGSGSTTDGGPPCPEWAIPYEEAAASAPGRTVAPWGRSGDDLYLLYTGGTTGMPEGRDVAPGRPDRQPRRRVAAPASRPSRRRTRWPSA